MQPGSDQPLSRNAFLWKCPERATWSWTCFPILGACGKLGKGSGFRLPAKVSPCGHWGSKAKGPSLGEQSKEEPHRAGGGLCHLPALRPGQTRILLENPEHTPCPGVATDSGPRWEPLTAGPLQRPWKGLHESVPQILTRCLPGVRPQSRFCEHITQKPAEPWNLPTSGRENKQASRKGNWGGESW